MRLFIVRHGKAEDRAGPGGSDRERRLTARGERQAGFIGATLGSLAPEGTRLVVSPVERARHTGAIIGAALGLTAEFDERLSTASGIEGALAVISESAASRRWAGLVVVGHNPTLEELAWWLAPDGSEHAELKTGQCVMLELEGQLRRGAGSTPVRYRLED